MIRRCRECGKRLNCYNRSSLCHVCFDEGGWQLEITRKVIFEGLEPLQWALRELRRDTAGLRRGISTVS